MFRFLGRILGLNEENQPGEIDEVAAPKMRRSKRLLKRRTSSSMESLGLVGDGDERLRDIIANEITDRVVRLEAADIALVPRRKRSRKSK
ncbi:Hypothetical predicted protein [Cloeon dipterum]|uniref:Uncharacterized protein n=1 Tax=Cloeon dipterum TaxID=197152 RepID=A0A8S1DGN1_9INSE|nr:Hypothetical predicted protein [Cloeon dipterum]